MKRSAVLVSTTLAVALPVGLCAESGSNDAVGEIRALELAHNGAIARGEVSVIEKLTSDDFTFVTPRGFLVTKQEMLKGLANGAFNYEYRQIYDVKIRVYGDAAVVTGLSVHTVQGRNGKDCSDTYRYTRVYIREKGHWVSVAWQTTRDDEQQSYAPCPTDVLAH
jgi:ketosteroid isomerase-like protein